MTRYRLVSCDDVPEGKAVVAEAGEERLLVSHVGGSYCAIDDVCTHDGGPLGEGELYGDEVECPRHGARFNVCTGRVTRMPAVRPVKAHTVEVEDGSLYVEIEEAW